jgi:hypothetical protein
VGACGSLRHGDQDAADAIHIDLLHLGRAAARAARFRILRVATRCFMPAPHHRIHDAAVLRGLPVFHGDAPCTRISAKGASGTRPCVDACARAPMRSAG